MVIVVPEGLSVTIELNSGMTGVTLSDGFTRAGDTIYSKNFNENKDSVKLKVNLPMGSLKVMHP
jgi:predicted membrane protein